MSKKHSAHAKLQWSKVSPETRSAHASKMAKARQAKMTPEQRKALAKKMSDARWHPEKVINTLSPTDNLQEK